MTSALRDLLVRQVEEGTLPGAVALLGRGAQAEVVAVGTASADGRPLQPDAIVRIQSMTKVVTAVAALRLVEQGAVGLDDSVERWLPELAGRRVLTTPTSALDDTVPARRPITLRHLLTNGSGYGMPTSDSPIATAMAANQTEAGAEPVTLGADEWLARLSELPLSFQPGEGWRYHHSFGLLGILLARHAGRPLGEHLAEDLFEPLGMTDTGFWVPTDRLDRLPAAYRHGPDGLVETEPAGGGFYAGPPPFDVSHAELVSTVADFHRFTRMLVDGGRVADGPAADGPAADGYAGSRSLVSADHVRQLTSDQVPAENKTPDSFFPGFWDGMGWGFGVGVQTQGPQRGRYGWAGGQGTDFFVDPDGTVGILFTQVELGERTFPLLGQFQALHPPA